MSPMIIEFRLLGAVGARPNSLSWRVGSRRHCGAVLPETAGRRNARQGNCHNLRRMTAHPRRATALARDFLDDFSGNPGWTAPFRRLADRAESSESASTSRSGAMDAFPASALCETGTTSIRIDEFRRRQACSEPGTACHEAVFQMISYCFRALFDFEPNEKFLWSAFGGVRMKMISKALLAIVALAAFDAAPAAATTNLLGETLNANIAITGEDDNGFYTLPVLGGSVTVGPSGFSDNIPVFKQLTEDGFSTPTNQITGNVIIDISANAISVEMTGQVQPFQLESQFSGIGGSSFHIVSDADSATGVQSGVNLDLFSNFGPHSVDFATFYLGFQPRTDLTQTETLTFAPGAGAVPEPATWALMLLGFAGLGFAGYRRTKSGAPTAASA
jgi:hypothetical protein